MNYASFNTSDIEMGLDFSREDYETARAASPAEHLDFDEFLDKVFDITVIEGGDLEDAIFVAEDAYRQI